MLPISPIFHCTSFFLSLPLLLGSPWELLQTQAEVSHLPLGVNCTKKYPAFLGGFPASLQLEEPHGILEQSWQKAEFLSRSGKLCLQSSANMGLQSSWHCQGSVMGRKTHGELPVSHLPTCYVECQGRKVEDLPQDKEKGKLIAS